MTTTLKYGDSLHHALEITGTLLLQSGKLSAHESECLGCLLLILADYQARVYQEAEAAL